MDNKGIYKRRDERFEARVYFSSDGRRTYKAFYGRTA